MTIEAQGISRLSASLYVGDIPKDLENPEDSLFQLFGTAGNVISIKVCRDINTQTSLGYAYVNFQNPADAERALETLNYSDLNGKEIRIMWAARDPITRKQSMCNVFVKNLDPAMTNRQLYELGSQFGHVVACKQAESKNGTRRGYGFIYYDTPEIAEKAIAGLNGYNYNNFEIKAAPFVNRTERVKEAEKTFTTVYAKNIASNVTEEEVKEVFGKYGEITSIYLSSGVQFQTKYAIIVLESHDGAVKAIEELNNSSNLVDKDGKLFVSRLRHKADIPPQVGPYQNDGRNVYVKYLTDDITQEKLREIFSQFGNIESISLQSDDKGNFRGFAFICFESKEASAHAVSQLHMKYYIKTRPIYVQLAQNKDVRHRMLEAQRRQIEQQSRMQQQYFYQWNNQMRMFPPMGQQINPGMQVQLPGNRGPRPQNQNRNQNMNFRPNSIKPNPQQQQQYQQLQQQQIQLQQQQPRNAYPINNYPPMQQQPMQQPPQMQPQLSQNEFSQQLANMNPQERKNFLGERLYGQIYSINPQLAAKITGMLLEMDTPEILHILEDSNMLYSKVQEAITVLHAHEASH